VLHKVLRYHLPLADVDPMAAMRSMAAHWAGFSWRSGPVIVRWAADGHPELQVWAESESEGRRVILHCLSHTGTQSDAGEWYISFVDGKRNGVVATVRATMASARGSGKGIAPHIPIS
jgi:hypothetical protein